MNGWSFAKVWEHAVGHVLGGILLAVGSFVGLWLLSFWDPAWNVMNRAARWFADATVTFPIWSTLLFVIVAAYCLWRLHLASVDVVRETAKTPPPEPHTVEAQGWKPMPVEPEPAAPPQLDENETDVMVAMGLKDGDAVNEKQIADVAKKPRLLIQEAIASLVRRKLIRESMGPMGVFLYLTDEGRKYVIEKKYLRKAERWRR